MRWVLAEEVVFEADPIKGSRFIARAIPIAAADEVGDRLAQSRAQHPGASHHAFAWVLATPASQRSNDDGEPGGTAGRPILAQILGHEVIDVLVIVTRYFGGTKLGAGGLVRAYGGTAGKALDQAALDPFVPMTTVRVVYDYPQSAIVDGMLREHGLEIVDSRFETRVVRTLRLPTERARAWIAELSERSSGAIEASTDV